MITSSMKSEGNQSKRRGWPIVTVKTLNTTERYQLTGEVHLEALAPRVSNSK